MDYLKKKIFMRETQIDVDVEASPLSKSLQSNRLWGKRNMAENFTIFRTPHKIFKNKKNLFEPSVISIGPFHHGRKHLRAMEEQKWRFLEDFLFRGSHINFNLCISQMKLLEERTRGCYSEAVDLESNAFVEMMLLDGCYVLEFFLKIRDGPLNSIFEVGWNYNFIVHDLLLLDNQIPFFIVEKLYDIGKIPEFRSFVKCIASNFWDLGLTKDLSPDIIPDPPANIHHLVHLCYHSLVPYPGKPPVLSSKPFYLTRMFNANRIKDLLHGFLSRVNPRFASKICLLGPLPNPTGNISSMVIPTATELKLKGLKFTPNRKPEHMLDISFERGALNIPRQFITDDNKPIFTNLIAFEHSKYGKLGAPFTSFVVFLDNLVNTQNDVTILQECGIIENRLGSEEALTHFFNHVTEGGRIEGDHYLAELYQEVNRYIESSWHRNRAKLIRDYFSSPCATISLIAAFILLVLTFVQSFLAVFSYIRPPKQ